MNLEELVGNWENFENYFDDPSYAMQKAWKEAEKATADQKKNLISKYLFRHGAKAFWQSACYTVNKENKTKLGSLVISKEGDALLISWKDSQDQEISTFEYVFDSVIEKGLEGKENYLFKTTENSPFKWVLFMEPFPERNAKENGGMISHFHFQYASKKELLVNSKGKLKNSHWYATMCDKDVSMLQRCNIVLALHKVNTWDTLPIQK